jgi:predicted anti-sigma-YlaC factor YlaD
VVSRERKIVELDCEEVRSELSNYLDCDLTAEMRLRIDDHLRQCAHCAAIYDGVRNVVRLLGDEKIIDLPTGFSERLYRRLLRAR